MEMRASEDITAIGQDLTPPLPPLAFALHDSALNSHCSACFSPLPPQPFSPITPPEPQNPHYVPTLLYCSPRCSSLDSPLHFSSAEPHLLSLFRQSPPSTWHDSSDLRLALRLLRIFQKIPDNDVVLERIGGLMTNREMLIFREIVKNSKFRNCEEICENVDCCEEIERERIKEGAKVMAIARSMCVGEGLSLCSNEEVEMVLCLVLTNAVEVQDKSGCSVGIAVYGTEFSWINHSCSPNACYRFSIGLEHNEEQVLRILPAASESGCGNAYGDKVMMKRDTKALLSGKYGYGPRVIVRSMKPVNKGEEVTIAYTDLLQPKEMRQAELWLKYKFRCCCRRCSAVPATYVDCSLQAVCIVKHNFQEEIYDHDFSEEEEIKKLTESFDEAITDYLSYNEPKLCCEKLEHLLRYGKFNEQLNPRAHQELKLHPFHHVSLNAFTTLASAYKVCASDLLALDSGTDVHKLQAFNMSKASAAYSLLLAGVSNHLFMFESSLMPSIANSWINAGESLLNLTRNALWDSLLKPEPLYLKSSSLSSHKCHNCTLAEIFTQNSVNGCLQNIDLEEISRQQLNCIANISSKVWSSLTSGSSFLKSIQNPIDFSWLESVESFPFSNVESHIDMSVIKKGFSRLETEQLRVDLTLLSIHCLRYGALLSRIFYRFPLSIDMYLS